MIGASSFQSPCSPVLCFFYPYSFLLHVFSYNITPPQFRSSYLPMSTNVHLLCSQYQRGFTYHTIILMECNTADAALDLSRIHIYNSYCCTKATTSPLCSYAMYKYIKHCSRNHFNTSQAVKLCKYMYT